MANLNYILNQEDRSYQALVEAVVTESDADASSTDLTFLQSYQQSSITQTPESVKVSIPQRETITKFIRQENKPNLLSNFAICWVSTPTLFLNKPRKFPEFLQLYDAIIKEQQQRGFIERVTDNIADNVHYLLHYLVKEVVTTSIRIVFDGSYHGGGKLASLNDCLKIGPPFLYNLCAILLSFHIHGFPLSTDIEKVFLHFKLDPTDRNFTKFLWPSNVENFESDLQAHHFYLGLLENFILKLQLICETISRCQQHSIQLQH